MVYFCCMFFFSSRRRHTRWPRDWSSDVCSSDLIADFYRIGAAADFDDGGGSACGVFEVVREAIGVNRGGRDDEFEIGPARQELREVTEQEINVEAAFMGLINNDRVVFAQFRVALDSAGRAPSGLTLARGVAA